MSWSPWVYIVLLGIAAILYAWIMPERKQPGRAGNGTIDEVEMTLEQYMAEMERDNQEIVNLVGQMKQETVSKQLSQQEQIGELRQRLLDYERRTVLLEERLQQLENTDFKTAGSLGPETLPVPSQQVPVDVIEEEPAPLASRVRDRYPELFSLYDEGKSIDIVAKSVGIARGEVQLILQLAKREESL
ncbi:hypothetical protein [Paenibacillus caui]|uniref:hypothetical protein n=1 Tax=Paenibacillus caui TaxID=2873927 RepID=UPI001CA833BB|nr:hypothetical protein [Paenibacillus caui]